MDGVTPGMITGVTTEALAGEKMIVTAGALDTHVHFICPQLVDEALASGVTTLYGGGTGPNHGTLATTITPAPSQVQMMLQATDAFPMNFGFSGKGNMNGRTNGNMAGNGYNYQAPYWAAAPYGAPVAPVAPQAPVAK